MPFGVTLIGPAWSEEALLETADLLHRAHIKSHTVPPAMWRSQCVALT